MKYFQTSEVCSPIMVQQQIEQQQKVQVFKARILEQFTQCSPKNNRFS